MGPNFFSSREGAVLDVRCGDEECAPLLLAWRTEALELATRLGWHDAEAIVRPHPGGAQCFLSAPVDALLTATEVNERAWQAAECVVAGGVAPDRRDAVARLMVHRQHEARPALVALQHEAHARGVTFTYDDECASIGAGAGSARYALTALPLPGHVDWRAVHDIPVALVTGSNGKTTTTRLIAAMLADAGHVTGLTSTDGVWCAGEMLDHGDYSGPVGARLVLRDRRVTAAVLETARGGMLRRGLATDRCNVAVVTQVSADHMGEYGIHDLRSLAEAKLIVARALVPGGRLVLNADDAMLVALAPAVQAPISWFSLDASSRVVATHRASGGEGCLVRDGALWAVGPAGEQSLGDVAAMPITLGGAARYNIANALAASAAALALGVAPSSVRNTLQRFGARPEDNPGRLSLLRYRGARLVVDFVHNPDGWYALWHALRHVPATRRVVVVGQAGDRDDGALDEMANAVWSERPDLVILKELPKYRRGRPAFETRERLARALVAAGARVDALRRTDTEGEALQLALAVTREGDLLVLAVHDDYRGAMQWLQQAGAEVVSSLE